MLCVATDKTSLTHFFSLQAINEKKLNKEIPLALSGQRDLYFHASALASSWQTYSMGSPRTFSIEDNVSIVKL